LGWDGTSKYQRECFFWLGWFLPGPVVRLVEANTRDKNTSEWAGFTLAVSSYNITFGWVSGSKHEVEYYRQLFSLLGMN
jgi:hypothetical protein